MTDKEKESAKPKAETKPKTEEKPKADTSKPKAETKAATDTKSKGKAESKDDKASKKAKSTDKGSPEKKGNKANQFFKGMGSSIKGKFDAIGKKRAAKKAAAKKAKLAEPKYPFVDKPKKPQKHSKYVHKVVQLDKRDNQFTESKFHEIHKISNSREVNESLHRIGKCLNKADLMKLPGKEADKICLILINNYDNDANGLGVQPLNDAYLFALIHHKLGYKIVYLYNPTMVKYLQSLEYFLTFTSLSLTIYYTGRDSFSRVRSVRHGIQFDEQKEIVSDYDLGKLISSKWNGKCRIFFLNDCSCEGSIIDMRAVKNTPNGRDIEIVSFSSNKKNLKPKEKRLSQGLLTYYFCKLMSQFPNSTPAEMANMLTISFERFKIGFVPLLSKDSLNESPIFPGAGSCFNTQNQAAPQQQQQQKQDDKPVTEPIPA